MATNENRFYLPPFRMQEVTTPHSELIDWGIKFLDVDEVWKRCAGEGVTVMVADTGCDLDHPDINLAEARDFTGSRVGADDLNGHGCVAPDSYVFTSLCGLEAVETMFNRSPGIAQFHIDGSVVKDLRSRNITTVSLEKDGAMRRRRILAAQKLNYDGPLIDVETKRGSISLTPWHPVYVQTSARGGQDESVVKRRADELQVGDRVVSSRPNTGVTNRCLHLPYRKYWECRYCGHKARGSKRTHCRRCGAYRWQESPAIESITLGRSLAYVCGLVASDGHLVKKQKTVLFFNKDKRLVERFSRNCQNVFGRKPICYPDRDGLVRAELNSAEAWTLLKNIGIPVGNKSRKIQFPETIAKSPSGVIFAFVAGLIDGDGCVSSRKIRVATGSQSFADKLCVLMRSLGIRSSVSAVKPSNTGLARTERESYSVSIGMDRRLVKRMGLKRIVPSKHGNRFSVSRIRSISTRKYVGPMYDFTVEGSPNYVANGLVVSNTWCCGYIGATANETGVRGVAYKLKSLYSAKVLGDSGAGTERTIAMAIEWAKQLDVNFISMSLGGGRMSGYMRDMLREFTSVPGHFVIAAAGNDGRPDSVNYPARWPETIGVAAVNRNGQRARFSSMGEGVDTAAPGVDMISCAPNGQYAKSSGTSMATPLVCGVSVLAYSAHQKANGDTPIDTTEELRELLHDTAIDVGNDGWDPEYGYGIIDPDDMLPREDDPIPEPDPEPGPEPQPTLCDTISQICLAIHESIESLKPSA